VLELPDSLMPLIEDIDGIDGKYRRGDSFPPFNVHCPLLSLPLAFGTTLASIPALVPYHSRRLPAFRFGVSACPTSISRASAVWSESRRTQTI
jgi:hypothetical protein